MIRQPAEQNIVARSATVTALLNVVADSKEALFEETRPQGKGGRTIGTKAGKWDARMRAVAPAMASSMDSP